MTSELGAIAALVGALGGALVLTPWLGRVALRAGAVDHPDGRRKHHQGPIPRAGGLAVALAATAATIVALALIEPAVPLAPWLLKGLVPALLVLLLVGLADDTLGLTGIYKLIGQMLAVSLLVAGGLKFETISLFSATVPLGDLCIPFTIFFCLGAINAFNLVDGADGLAASIGAIVCLTLGTITFARGDVAGAVVACAVAGALVGFLRYNLPPAKVYLGDTGSMLIGLVVAAIAIESSIKQQAAFALLVPIAICTIPILDAAAALVRRVTTGQSVFAADRGHLHHALLVRGWSVGRTVAFIAGLTALTCGGALAGYFAGSDLFALLTAGGVVVALMGTKIFGHAEMALIASRLRGLLRRALKPRRGQPATVRESCVRLQGKREWQVLWVALCEAAPARNLSALTLQVSIPQLHESFYATWSRDADVDVEDPWRLGLPLMLDGEPIGKLSFVGTTSGRQALADIEQLVDFLEPLESHLAALIYGEDERAAALAKGTSGDRHRAVLPFVPRPEAHVAVGD